MLPDGNLVGEYAADEITKLELVTAMIGKDMIKIFDLKPPTVAEGADVMLAADRLGAPGAIDEISLTVKKGEMIGFAGLLGSGRTETAQLLFGVVKPTHGQMTLKGKPTVVKSPSDAIGKNMAFCPEDRKRDGIIGDLTVRENIMLALQSRRGMLKPIPRQEQQELAEKSNIKMLGPIATPDPRRRSASSPAATSRR